MESHMFMHALLPCSMLYPTGTVFFIPALLITATPKVRDFISISFCFVLTVVVVVVSQFVVCLSFHSFASLILSHADPLVEYKSMSVVLRPDITSQCLRHFRNFNCTTKFGLLAPTAICRSFKFWGLSLAKSFRGMHFDKKKKKKKKKKVKVDLCASREYTL